MHHRPPAIIMIIIHRMQWRSSALYAHGVSRGEKLTSEHVTEQLRPDGRVLDAPSAVR